MPKRTLVIRKYMSSVFLALGVALLCCSFPLHAAAEASEEWVLKSWLPIDAGINDLDFADPRNGWAVSNYHVFTTHDGGQTWNAMAVAGLRIHHLVRITFPDPHHGYLLDTGGDIYRTSDGGAHWVGQDHASSTEFRNDALAAPSPATVYVGLYHGGIGKSTNGGLTWRWSARPTNIAKIVFTSPRIGWAISLSTPDLWHTSDGGTTWATVPISTTHLFLSDIFFPMPRIGYAVPSLPGPLMRTTDGGATWKPDDPLATGHLLNPAGVVPVYGTQYPFDDIRFRSPKQGMMLINRLHIIETVDGGNTWTAHQLPTGSGNIDAVAYQGATPIAIVSSNQSFINVPSDPFREAVFTPTPIATAPPLRILQVRAPSHPVRAGDTVSLWAHTSPGAQVGIDYGCCSGGAINQIVQVSQGQWHMVITIPRFKVVAPGAPFPVLVAARSGSTVKRATITLHINP